MILVLENGKQLRGDMIKSAVLRNDLAPICETLEAEIRYDKDIEKYLQKDRVIEAGFGNKHRIIKMELQAERAMQGERPMAAFRITTFLDSVHQLGFVRRTAVIKNTSSLSGIYRACGCTFSGVGNDFSGAKFHCFAGDVPSYQVAALLQEEGGVVRYRRGNLSFLRLLDLQNQKGDKTLPANAIHETDSGFLERHEIPMYYSLDKSGDKVTGNQSKDRRIVFVPGKDARQLMNMTRVLVRTSVTKIEYSGQYFAGDVVNLSNDERRIIMTAAHVYKSGTDGGSVEQYTRLWLGVVESRR